MDPEKVGKFIKDIRKKNNLTQKELADKYGVTYQAVSKWENGNNLPDVSLLRELSKDFNIPLEDILDGENKTKKKNNIFYLLPIVIILLIIVIVFLFLKVNSNNSFEFKTLTTSCKDFNVTGSIAYDSKKSAIYISNIDYCGGNDTTIYKTIKCNLYEKHNKTITKVGSCNVNKKNITLEEYLKLVKININNYERMCKNYSHDDLYLEINAKDENDKMTTYKINLKTDDSCDR